jgi:hypothetical protein
MPLPPPAPAALPFEDEQLLLRMVDIDGLHAFSLRERLVKRAVVGVSAPREFFDERVVAQLHGL